MNNPHSSHRARRRAVLFATLATATPGLALAALPIEAQASGIPNSASIHALPCGNAYTVRMGDTLSSISVACGVPLATLLRLNRVGSYLYAGQVLLLTDPNARRSYVVRPGDSLNAIAYRLGLAPATLAADNGLAANAFVLVGQVLYYRPTQAGAVMQATATTARPAGTMRYSAATSTPSGGYRWYRVRLGDTLSGIALANGVTQDVLRTINRIGDPRRLPVGLYLRIPASGTQTAGGGGGSASTAAPAPVTATVARSSGVYKVQPGDTLSGIALSLKLLPATLAAQNGLSLSRPIVVGQVLHYISAGAAVATAATPVPVTNTPVAVAGFAPTQVEIGVALNNAAARRGVETSFVKAVAFQESSWRMVDAFDGGIGVMQMQPETVSWLKASYLPGPWDPHNYLDNIDAGTFLLRFYDNLYGGDLIRAATAYHGGMGAAQRPPTLEMQGYLASVERLRQTFLAGLFPR